MQWVTVQSSDLGEVAHDGSDLLVRFHSGGSGRYLGVPRDVFDELLAAPSKGKFLHARLKPRFTWVPDQKG